MLIEQMNTQIEGLSEEVASLTEFQVTDSQRQSETDNQANREADKRTKKMDRQTEYQTDSLPEMLQTLGPVK